MSKRQKRRSAGNRQRLLSTRLSDCEILNLEVDENDHLHLVHEIYDEAADVPRMRTHERCAISDGGSRVAAAGRALAPER